MEFRYWLSLEWLLIPGNARGWTRPGISGLWRVLMEEAGEERSVFRGLWRGWQSRQMRVFSRYYLPCHRELTLFCLGLLKDRELAENAASDTLVKLLEQPRPEAIEHVESWLFTVAKNQCLTLLEKQRRRAGIMTGLAPVFGASAPPAGEQHLMAQDLAGLIEATLNGKELAIWQLHGEGYDNGEIGERLGLPEKTVANLKSLARGKLRERLGREQTEETE